MLNRILANPCSIGVVELPRIHKACSTTSCILHLKPHVIRSAERTPMPSHSSANSIFRLTLVIPFLFPAAVLFLLRFHRHSLRPEVSKLHELYDWTSFSMLL